MTKMEFLSLPPAIALEFIYDGSPRVQEIVTKAEKPKSPYPPKYDMRLFRKSGFVWASESSIGSLRFWYERALESAASGGQYAEKDKKKAEDLKRWINWRHWEPDAVWSGTRGDSEVIAAPPSRQPRVHSTEPRAPVRGDAYEDAGEGADDLNF